MLAGENTATSPRWAKPGTNPHSGKHTGAGVRGVAGEG